MKKLWHPEETRKEINAMKKGGQFGMRHVSGSSAVSLTRFKEDGGSDGEKTTERTKEGGRA